MSKGTISLPSSARNQETGGATVSVASKLPMPYVLRLTKKVERVIQAHGGTHREIISLPAPELGEYIVDGCSFAQNKGPHQQLAGGFAITHGIPKAFWEKWLEQYAQMDSVKNGFIFAYSEAASTVSRAREMEDVKSGFERIDPSKKHTVGNKIRVNEKQKELTVETEGT